MIICIVTSIKFFLNVNIYLNLEWLNFYKISKKKYLKYLKYFFYKKSSN